MEVALQFLFGLVVENLRLIVAVLLLLFGLWFFTVYIEPELTEETETIITIFSVIGIFVLILSVLTAFFK